MSNRRTETARLGVLVEDRPNEATLPYELGKDPVVLVPRPDAPRVDRAPTDNQNDVTWAREFLGKIEDELAEDSVALPCGSCWYESLRARFAEVRRQGFADGLKATAHLLERDRESAQTVDRALFDEQNKRLYEAARDRDRYLSELAALRKVAEAAHALADVPCSCDDCWTARGRHDPRGCVWVETADLRAALDALPDIEVGSPNPVAAKEIPNPTGPHDNWDGDCG